MPFAMRAAVAFAVPGRRVELRLGVELDDLGAGEDPGGAFGEAHHDDRAEREVRRVEARDARLAREAIELVRVEAGRPDDERDAGLEAAGRVGQHGVRPGEVDRDVAPDRPVRAPVHDVVPGVGERGAEHRPDLAGRAEEADPHDRSASAGLMRASAPRNRLSRGPMPAAESRSGA